MNIFKIKLKDIIVGTLTYNDIYWEFKYSNEFKNQEKYIPISNFPNKNHIYTSSILFPFFASRIPSPSQLQTEKSKKEEIVTLLQKYGTYSIQNPYIVCSIT